MFSFPSDDGKVPLEQIRFFPNHEGVQRMTQWMEVAVARKVVKYCKGLASYRKFIRYQTVMY